MDAVKAIRSVVLPEFNYDRREVTVLAVRSGGDSESRKRRVVRVDQVRLTERHGLTIVIPVREVLPRRVEDGNLAICGRDRHLRQDRHTYSMSDARSSPWPGRKIGR